ncbi:FAD-linked oxidase OS=Streptomyces fumanus OX=67302 GN=GCM10018772_36800 PE=3 SV=1 [Streptomyces fumanus]
MNTTVTSDHPAPATPQEAAPRRHTGAIPTVTPDDARYPDMIRGHGNNRHVASPEAIRLPSTTEQVVEIVREAVRDGKRVAVRSGGHCFENLVFNDETEIIIDLRLMNDVGFDEDRGAFVVEPGATLLKSTRPCTSAGASPSPAAAATPRAPAGHFSGGGYGILSRKHGILSDHLYAVEIVTVDERGEVRAVVATRDPEDPHHDLAWAVAGGGGGNFGVVTRFWMRSRGAEGGPGALLPKAPSTVFSIFAAWSWEQITEEAFATFMARYADWSKTHGSLALALHRPRPLDLPPARRLRHLQRGRADRLHRAGRPQAGGRLPRVRAGSLGVQPQRTTITEQPFLKATAQTMTAGETITSPSLRMSYKSTYMKDAFPEHQVRTIYRYLTKTVNPNPYSFLVINSVRRADRRAGRRRHRGRPPRRPVAGVLRVLLAPGRGRRAERDLAAVAVPGPVRRHGRRPGAERRD